MKVKYILSAMSVVLLIIFIFNNNRGDLDLVYIGFVLILTRLEFIYDKITEFQIPNIEIGFMSEDSENHVEDYDHRNKEDVIKRQKERNEESNKFFERDIRHIEDYEKDRLKNIEFAFDNPDSKEQIIFHGGCHRCTMPEKVGIGGCIGCKCFTADWSLPNLNNND